MIDEQQTQVTVTRSSNHCNLYRYIDSIRYLKVVTAPFGQS